MVSRRMIVTNAEGLHLRSAGKFVEKMNRFECSVTILFKDARVDGKSLLNIMMAWIKCGAEIEIECDGADEDEALEAAVHVIEKELM